MIDITYVGAFAGAKQRLNPFSKCSDQTLILGLIDVREWLTSCYINNYQLSPLGLKTGCILGLQFAKTGSYDYDYC